MSDQWCKCPKWWTSVEFSSYFFSLQTLEDLERGCQVTNGFCLCFGNEYDQIPYKNNNQFLFVLQIDYCHPSNAKVVQSIKLKYPVTTPPGNGRIECLPGGPVVRGPCCGVRAPARHKSCACAPPHPAHAVIDARAAFYACLYSIYGKHRSIFYSAAKH